MKISPHIDDYHRWRLRSIEENPGWKDEEPSFFLYLYTRTYPARTFPLLLALYNHHKENVSRGTS